MPFRFGGQHGLETYGAQPRGRRRIRFSFMNIVEDPFALSTISIAVVRFFSIYYLDCVCVYTFSC